MLNRVCKLRNWIPRFAYFLSSTTLQDFKQMGRNDCHLSAAAIFLVLARK